MSEQTTKIEVVIYMTGLRYDEGLRLTPYKVSNGPRSIGYGHELTPEELRLVKHLTPDIRLRFGGSGNDKSQMASWCSSPTADRADAT